MTIKFQKLHPNAKPPTRAKEGDAGWDLVMTDIAAVASKGLGNGVFLFSTGIAVEIPSGYFGLLRPRSSISKTMWTMASSGIIDSGYRGEIKIALRYTGPGMAYIPGDRIAQLLILPLPDVTFEESTTLTTTDRGTGGFGSTGK